MEPLSEFLTIHRPLQLICSVGADRKTRFNIGASANRVFHDKIKFYILRQNLHQTCFNDFSNVKWCMKQTLV